MQPPDPDIRLVTILRTRDAGLVAFVTSLLEDAGIDHLVQGGGLRTFFAGRSGTLEVQVREADVDEARTLLADLEHPPE